MKKNIIVTYIVALSTYDDFCIKQIKCIMHNVHSVLYKKSLKIPKGQSESVYRRRTENTMAKRKSTKGQTTIYKTLQRKLKIQPHEPH